MSNAKCVAINSIRLTRRWADCWVNTPKETSKIMVHGVVNHVAASHWLIIRLSAIIYEHWDVSLSYNNCYPPRFYRPDREGGMLVNNRKTARLFSTRRRRQLRQSSSSSAQLSSISAGSSVSSSCPAWPCSTSHRRAARHRRRLALTTEWGRTATRRVRMSIHNPTPCQTKSTPSIQNSSTFLLFFILDTDCTNAPRKGQKRVEPVQHLPLRQACKGDG